MKKINIKAPAPSLSHEALVFFALALDDQLFDLTDDSFKAPALTTFTRTHELQAIARANHLAGIAKEALVPFIDELEWSISNDPVLDAQQRALCKHHVETIRATLGEPDRISRSVSGLRIVIGNYFKSAMAVISKVILEEPTHKKELLALASCFIVQAEAHGFPRRHTYHVAQNVLLRELRRDSVFDPATLLSSFFSNFSPTKQEYDCWFLVDKSHERFPKLLEAFKIAIEAHPPDLPALSADQRLFLASRREGQVFAHLTDIKAYGPAQAHEIGAGVLDEFAAITGFHHHKLSLTRSALSLISTRQTNRAFLIHNAPDPMHCWVSHNVPGEADMLSFMSASHGPRLLEESARRLQRSIRLHRSAINAGSPENQLIDLWASLEGLLSTPGKDSQRLEFFSESLLPALMLSYPEKLLLSAYCDLRRVLPKSVQILTRLPGDDSEFSKFVRTLLAQEHTEPRADLIAAMKTHPLMLNKAWRMSEIFATRRSIRTNLKKHRQRVKWHLARIYFTRNSIMHSATALPHLRTLVENLHVYFDTLMSAIHKTASSTSERPSIEGVIQYLASWERLRLQEPATPELNDARLTDADLWEVVFGAGMALTPKQNWEPSFT